MKADILVQMVKSGKKPMVKLTNLLWDESFGREGMICRVVGVNMEDHIHSVSFKFDYNEHREHNLALDSADWFTVGENTGTAIEAGIFADPNNLQEEVLFPVGGDVPVEFMGDLLKEYVDAIESDRANSANRTYVKWLESELQKARWSISRE